MRLALEVRILVIFGIVKHFYNILIFLVLTIFGTQQIGATDVFVLTEKSYACVKDINNAGGSLKKAVKLANIDDLGKASVGSFSLLDEAGNITGELKRVIGKGGKEVRYFYTDFKGGNGLIINQQYKMSPSEIPNYEILDAKLLDNFIS